MQRNMWSIHGGGKLCRGSASHVGTRAKDAIFPFSPLKEISFNLMKEI